MREKGFERYGTRTLTERERRVAALVAEGLTSKDIAILLGIQHMTVKNKLRIIYDKLGFNNRVQLALWYTSHENSNHKI